LDHVENDDGRLLFEQIVKMDLEGMVCRRKSSPYRVTEKPSPYWIKVKNPSYSQAEGREELFKRSAFPDDEGLRATANRPDPNPYRAELVH
jgi:hypothetical protein